MRNQMRNANGNMYVLVISLATLIFVPVLMLVCRVGIFESNAARAQSVVEAAAKVAAMDLSRIVITDANFGYVSLSNHAAVGKATVASEGELLPVTAIDTISGTLRQAGAVAEALQNERMKYLVARDEDALQDTIKELNKKLETSLTNGRALDIDGKPVTTAEDVESFIAKNLPGNLQMQSIRLSLGRLEGAKGAGLDQQAHLVSASTFREPDNQSVCPVIKLECTFVSSNEPDAKIQTVAYCQPHCLPDAAPRGAMTVRFSGRFAPQLLSLRELLSSEYFHDNRVTAFDIKGGDFPVDQYSKMQQVEAEETGTANQFAEHIYYWLRNGRMHAKTEAIVAALNEPFRNDPNQVLTYAFEDNGTVSRSMSDGRSFPRVVTADGQFASMADTCIRGGTTAIVFFRDNVMRLAPDSGKHGGQPLAGLALDIEIGGTGESTAQADVLAMRQRTRFRKI